MKEFTVDRRLRKSMIWERRRSSGAYWVCLLLQLLCVAASPLMWQMMRGYQAAERERGIQIVLTPYPAGTYDGLIAAVLTGGLVALLLVSIWAAIWYLVDSSVAYKIDESLALTEDSLVNGYRRKDRSNRYRTNTCIGYEEITGLSVYSRERVLKVHAPVHYREFLAFGQGMVTVAQGTLKDDEGFRLFPLYYKNAEELASELSRRTGIQPQVIQSTDRTLTEKRV